jgi:tetratricopeptide (TPR) repeat protein
MNQGNSATALKYIVKLGDIYYGLEQWSGATQMYSQVAKNQHMPAIVRVPLLYRLARSHEANGDFMQAEFNYKLAIDEAKDSFLAAHMLDTYASMLRGRGQEEAAREVEATARRRRNM